MFFTTHLAPNIMIGTNKASGVICNPKFYERNIALSQLGDVILIWKMFNTPFQIILHKVAYSCVSVLSSYQHYYIIFSGVILNPNFLREWWLISLIYVVCLTLYCIPDKITPVVHQWL